MSTDTLSFTHRVSTKTWSTAKGVVIASITFQDGIPQGYTYLGVFTEGIKVPSTNDWLALNLGKGITRSFSPALLVYFDSDR
jgi:hypothetical protein